MKMSTETLLWLESTGSAVPVREVLWWKLMVCCYGDTPVHSCWPPVVHCALPHCKQQPEEGKGDKRDVHMRALSLCNLELYVRDTVFQASIYRSIHMAIHFCSELSSVLPGLPMHFLKHLSVILCSSSCALATAIWTLTCSIIVPVSTLPPEPPAEKSEPKPSISIGAVTENYSVVDLLSVHVHTTAARFS